MIKILSFIFKWFIMGSGCDDFELCFDLTVSFDKALEYLKRGYIIYDWSEMTCKKRLYIMIDDEIFMINRNNNGKSEKVQGFTSEAMTNHRWKIIPLGKQVELSKKKVEYND